MEKFLNLCLLLLTQILFVSPSFAAERNQKEVSFEGVKRVKILVSQSYGEAKGVNLPFQDVVSRFLSRAGIEVVGDEGEDYDAIVQIEVNGKPIKGYYDKTGYLVYTPFPLDEYWKKMKETPPSSEDMEEYEGFPPGASSPFFRPSLLFATDFERIKEAKESLYTGAILKGNIKLIGKGGEMLSEEFEGVHPPDDWLERFGYYINIFASEPGDAPFLDAFLDRDSFVDKFAFLMGKAFGIRSLISALADEDWKVVRSTRRALEKFGTEAIEYLASALDDPLTSVRTSAVEILGHLKNPLCFEYLLKALKDPSPTVRSLAASGLGKLGDKRAVERLLEAVEEKSSEVRASAASALGELKEPRALAKLLKLARDTLEDKEVRREAILAIGKIGGEEAVNELLNIAQTRIVDP
ncbi:HEAT repeat domain-containing protein [bacterium]|nr:HEAT repeat domain-containing protein [bacterium]